MRDPQILLQSLVEGDSARVVRFRRLRRRAVLLSVAVEAMLLAALLLAPLATPGTLRGRLDWTPIPPYGGAPHVAVRPARSHVESATHHHFQSLTLFEPPSIPPRVDRSGDQESETQDSGAFLCVVPGCGRPEGPADGVLFGTDPGIRIQPSEPPTPPEQRPRIVRKSEGAQAALLEHRVVPEYPILARQTRTEGEVKLRAIITTGGTIRSLEVESGPPWLIQAALDAVGQWRYKPALLNGQPVEVDTFITVIFHLSR